VLVISIQVLLVVGLVAVAVAVAVDLREEIEFKFPEDRGLVVESKEKVEAGREKLSMDDNAGRYNHRLGIRASIGD
jgi:hypothetical protein